MNVINIVINPGKREKHFTSYLIKRESEITRDNNVENALNDYFVSIGENSRNNIAPTLNKHIDYLHNKMHQSMFLSPVLEKEVTDFIHGLNVTKKKSPVYDDISPKTVIFICNGIAHHFKYIMNQSLLMTRIVPVRLN